ncbi:MAG: signal recognition particle-docking protein FtsY [Eubacteriales bacterium]
MQKSGTKAGLEKTRKGLSEKLKGLFSAFKKADEDFLEELEEVLILSDMGVETAAFLIDKLRDRIKQEKIDIPEKTRQALIDIIAELLESEAPIFQSPTVMLIAGVNGVGKTTAIGKLAYRFKSEGNQIVLAAGDTFRAAASEQLAKWGKRANVPLVKHHEGADPGAVVFDAIKSAKAKDADMLICDTAGRLHNKQNLMEELEKIDRVIEKTWPEAVRKNLLVLDAATGQNAITQAKAFMQSIVIDGIILTKLDGTAKGGVVCAIRKMLDLPVYYIGVGEQMGDLVPFDAKAFSEALLDESE